MTAVRGARARIVAPNPPAWCSVSALSVIALVPEGLLVVVAFYHASTLTSRANRELPQTSPTDGASHVLGCPDCDSTWVERARWRARSFAIWPRPAGTATAEPMARPVIEGDLEDYLDRIRHLERALLLFTMAAHSEGICGANGMHRAECSALFEELGWDTYEQYVSAMSPIARQP